MPTPIAEWDGPVVFFDGDCGFCSRVVIFVAERDPNARFRFAPLQSAVGKSVLNFSDRSVDALDTVILMDGEDLFVKSTAALQIARRLRFPWSMAIVLMIVPRFARDWVYDLVARHRHRIFADDRCVLPSILAGRMLDADG